MGILFIYIDNIPASLCSVIELLQFPRQSVLPSYLVQDTFYLCVLHQVGLKTPPALSSTLASQLEKGGTERLSIFVKATQLGKKTSWDLDSGVPGPKAAILLMESSNLC